MLSCASASINFMYHFFPVKVIPIMQEIEDGYYEKYIGELYEVEDASQCDIQVAKAIEDYIEIYVTDVCVLSDAYIAVKYEIFSYSGGAHGSYL